MPPVVEPRKRRLLNQFVDDGYSVKAAAAKAGVSYSFARSYLKGHEANGEGYRRARAEEELPGPRRREGLCSEALRALEDFEFFRLRYFGHVSMPWQVEAAVRTVEMLGSAHREFVVVNCPPGSGKTTLFAHDIPAWLTCRDRAIRGLLGSRTARLAVISCRRLRRSLERSVPIRAREDDLRRGLAVDAVSTLAKDFGRFKPAAHTELWTGEQFVVEQLGDVEIAEKEPTWAAFGMDSGSLGWRVDYIGWDDLVDKKTIRTLDAVEGQREWYDDEAETRLEPGGLLSLSGQRLAGHDLSRWCLDKTVGDDDSDEDPEGFTSGELEALPVRDGRRRKYHHIVFRAHYEDRCEGAHGRDAAPWPDGCLLDPKRLPWRDLRAVASSGRKYRTVYQQEDTDPEDVLVPQLAVDGGTDPVSGVLLPGCWDRWREPGVVPAGLRAPFVSVATVDPSPTRFWSVQWWLFEVAEVRSAPGDIPAGPRLLIDLERKRMGADELLDWNRGLDSWTGLMESWQVRSVELGAKITHWVVERNAAQRFMLQYEHVRRWSQHHSAAIVPHDTYSNKADSKFGIEAAVGPRWPSGEVRLPGTKFGRAVSAPLVREATRWPSGETEDCVVGEWMFEFWLPRLMRRSDRKPKPQRWTPSWVRPVEQAAG